MSDKQGPVSLTAEDLDKVQGGTGEDSRLPGITPINIQGMDIETALMAVQLNRANLLETQLKDQISSIQDKNEHISDLNQGLGVLNQLSTKLEESGDESVSTSTKVKFDGVDMSLGDVAKALGLPDEMIKDGKLDKGEFKSAIEQVKGQVDSMSMSQQLDMLRLQSLSNKRNEAFDIMTNFVKKMQDARNAIIGNMR